VIQTLFAYENHDRIRSWNKSVLSNDQWVL